MLISGGLTLRNISHEVTLVSGDGRCAQNHIGWRLEIGGLNFEGPASFLYAPSPSGITPSNQEGEEITLASGDCLRGAGF